jgi:hypothetical protein
MCFSLGLVIGLFRCVPKWSPEQGIRFDCVGQSGRRIMACPPIMAWPGHRPSHNEQRHHFEGRWKPPMLPTGKKRRSNSGSKPFDLLLVALLALFVCFGLWKTPALIARLPERQAQPVAAYSKTEVVLKSADAAAQTLVIYVYSGSDTEYEANLNYFIREGVAVSIGISFVEVPALGSRVAWELEEVERAWYGRLGPRLIKVLALALASGRRWL